MWINYNFFKFLLPATIMLASLSGFFSAQKNNKNIAVKDEYWYNPQKTFEERRLLYLNYCASKSAIGDGREAVFAQIARLELNLPLQEDIIRESIAFVYTNKDCNDFAIGGLVRLLYLDKQQKKISPQLNAEIEKCLLNFKYWWDDPRIDEQYRCYHTENHQAIYHSDELLAGQLFKGKIFGDGSTGHKHIEHALIRLENWLNNRARFGFSEWLSNSYYEVDLMVLANLHDFSENKTIKTKASALIDLLLYDMALNNFHGVFGSTHGRAYISGIKGGSTESTSAINKLMFGVGIFNSHLRLGATALATSSYRCPDLIEKIATSYTETLDNKQRQSLNPDSAINYGFDFKKELDIHYFWGMQEFIHPKVINMSKKLSEKYNTWPYKNYGDFIKKYDQQIKEHGRIVNPHLDRFALGEVNIQTYRKADFMLSTSQNFRPGTQGYQQHIWQATLGIDAVVFTNHPGSMNERVTPNFWAGNAYLPKAAQVKNVSFCIYKIPEKRGIQFSHAYFPAKDFDEVIQKGNWTFGKKGKGYIALYSQNKAEWKTDVDGVKNELRANALQNIWICEMGDEARWNSFTNFIKAVNKSNVVCNDIKVQYQSPSLGKIEFGWFDPLVLNNKEIPLNNYKKFDNNYSNEDFPAKKIDIKKDKQLYQIDFALSK